MKSTDATCMRLRELFKTRERSHCLIQKRECGIGAVPQMDKLTCELT